MEAGADPVDRSTQGNRRHISGLRNGMQGRNRRDSFLELQTDMTNKQNKDQLSCCLCMATIFFQSTIAKIFPAEGKVLISLKWSLTSLGKVFSLLLNTAPFVFQAIGQHVLLAVHLATPSPVPCSIPNSLRKSVPVIATKAKTTQEGCFGFVGFF